MRRRWLFVTTGLVVVVAVGLVLLGRWETQHAVDVQSRGMRGVLAAVGGHPDSTRLSGFRAGPPVCFAYYGPRFLLQYQLCFDSQGRLVESVDRSKVQPVYYSLEYEPKLSQIRFSPARIDQVLRSAEATTH
jgi:hypothetical protein